MLRSHPNISSPTGESQFIVQLHRRAAEFGDLNKEDNIRRVLEEMRQISPEFIEEDLQGMQFDAALLARKFADRGTNTISRIVSALYETNARGEGKSRWLDKTPGYIRNLPTIFALFPDAQILHIIRDGRDCCLSMLRRKHDLKLFNIYYAALTWKTMVDAGQKDGDRLNTQAYKELRYEDLLNNPVALMRGICNFLNEPYTDKIIDFEKSSDPFSKTELLSKGLVTTNTKKWLNQLTERQVEIFESVAGDTLRRNGYQVSVNPKELRMIEKALYAMHQKTCKWVNPAMRVVRN